MSQRSCVVNHEVGAEGGCHDNEKLPAAGGFGGSVERAGLAGLFFDAGRSGPPAPVPTRCASSNGGKDHTRFPIAVYRGAMSAVGPHFAIASTICLRERLAALLGRSWGATRCVTCARSGPSKSLGIRHFSLSFAIVRLRPAPHKATPRLSRPRTFLFSFRLGRPCRHGVAYTSVISVDFSALLWHCFRKRINLMPSLSPKRYIFSLRLRQEFGYGGRAIHSKTPLPLSQ